MSVPKNGRAMLKKHEEPEAQQIAFDSDVLVPDEVIAHTRLEAENAQLRAQNAALNVQVLETRNELIKAKRVIDELVEGKNGKKNGSSNGNEGGEVRQAGGRGKAVKSKKR